MSEAAAPAAPTTSAATPSTSTPAPPTAKAPEAGTTVPTTAPVKSAPKPAVTKEPPKPGAPESAPAEAKPTGEEELFEVVVKGEKRKLTKADAIRYLQKELAAEENFRQAKELTKKNQAALSMLKENTAEALQQLGVDVDAFARSVLHKHIETELEAQLPEEERQARAEKRELEELRRWKQQQEEAKQQAAVAEQEKQAFAIMEKGILEAAKRNGLEGTPDNLYRIAEIATEFLDLEIPFTEDQIIAELREREDRAFSALEKKVTGGLKGEALAKRLGPAVVEEVLRWSVERIRGGGVSPAQPAPAQPVEPEVPAKKYVTLGEYMDGMRKQR